MIYIFHSSPPWEETMTNPISDLAKNLPRWSARKSDSESEDETDEEPKIKWVSFFETSKKKLMKMNRYDA